MGGWGRWQHLAQQTSRPARLPPWIHTQPVAARDVTQSLFYPIPLPHHPAITLGGVAAMLLICIVASWVRDKRPCHLWDLYGPGSALKTDRVSLRTPGAAGSSGSEFAEGTPSGGGVGVGPLHDPHFGTERERTLSGADADELDEFESGEVFSTVPGLQQPVQARATSSNLEMAGYPALA